MKKTTSFLVTIPALMLAAAVAHAEPGACQEPVQVQAQARAEDVLFKQMDANGDGVISKSEFNAFNVRRFKEMDANKDGKVTREEMENNLKKTTRNGLTHLDERFAAVDTNHDGGLNREEVQAMPVMLLLFDEVDTNHDGRVTREEYIAAMPLLHRVKNIPR